MRHLGRMLRMSLPGRRSAKDDGFTLLELLVVLVILGLLAAIATPQVMNYLSSAKVDAARLQVKNLGTNLELFRLDQGRYPTQDEGLIALVVRPATLDHWRGPFVKQKESLIDPWGSPYKYRVPGEHGEYDLWSGGPPGGSGSSGEVQSVQNW
jgi:general secretion pathway protein G